MSSATRTWSSPTAPTHLSSWESRVLDQRGGGASSVGLRASVFPQRLAQTLGGGGATVDRSSWRRRSRWSGEPRVLMPAPVIRMWLSVKLLGNLINLGQRNKCIHNWYLVKWFLRASGSKYALWWKVLPASGAEQVSSVAAGPLTPADLQGGLLFEDLTGGWRWAANLEPFPLSEYLKKLNHLGKKKSIEFVLGGVTDIEETEKLTWHWNN